MTAMNLSRTARGNTGASLATYKAHTRNVRDAEYGTKTVAENETDQLTNITDGKVRRRLTA